MSHASPPPTRVGLVGYGLAGAAFHAPLIEACADLALRVVVTGNAERAEAARARHAGVEVVATVDALLTRAADLDLVVVAAPNRAHGQVARAALEAGLDVVVDKPLCSTAAEARELVQFAADRGRLLTVFQNRRWDSDLRTLRALLAAGTLGAVHRFESRFERWRPAVGDGWREQPDATEGGGILLDLGAHLVDQALHLFGAAELEHAEVRAVRSGARVDDDAFLVLRHHDGDVRSHLWMSAAAAQPGPRMRVLGDASAWTSWSLDPQEAALRAGGAVGDGWGAVPRGDWGTLGATNGDVIDAHPHEPAHGDYPAFYAGVARSMRTGTPPPVDPRDAVRVLELLEQARALSRP